MKSIYLPVALTILGSTFYHIAQKSIPKTANPLYAIIIAYLTGLLICLSLLLFYPSEQPLRTTIKQLDWSMFLVGIGAVMIEIGFLLVYRTGWNISSATILVGAGGSTLLILIGVFFYKEHISIWNMLGILFCVLGVAFISKK
jgi:uncharacterized membrane protein YdcZ (DUF606 family)